MGLAEEFAADLESKSQSKSFQLENDFRAYLKDQGQGGSITNAPEEANPPIGAVLGGVGAAVATGNPVAATAGAAVGESLQQLVEHAVQSKNAPKTTGEALTRIGRETLVQGLFEVAGGAGTFLVEKARGLAPFAKGVTPEAKEAMQFVQQHGGGDTALLPAEMTSNRFLDIMQNISEHSLLGGGAIQMFKQDRDAFNTTLAQTIVGRYGPSMDADTIGRAVVDSATRNLEAAKYQSKFIYQAIESQAAPQYAKAPKKVTVTKQTGKASTPSKATPSQDTPGGDGWYAGKNADGVSTGEPPDVPEVRTMMQDIQVGEQLQRMRVMVTEQETQIGGARIDLRPMKDELASLTRTAKEGGGLADAAMGNTLLAFINGKPDLVSYPVAKAMRTEIRTYRDALKASPETKNAPGIAKADTIYGKMTEQIRKGLADDDPFLSTMWDEANLIEAGANQQYNTKFIRELVKLADMKGGGAPEAVAEKVWRPGRPTQIKVVRNAVDPVAWQKLQQIEMERLMSASYKDGVPNGKAMEQAFFGKEGLGEDALAAGFDGATVQELKDFAKTLKTEQAKAPDGTGRVWIQLAQATAAFQVVGAGMVGLGMMSDESGGNKMTVMGTGVMFTPPVVARIMASPGGIKWLTEGLTTSMKTKRGMAIATQLAKFIEPEVHPRMQPAAPTPNAASVQPMGNQE
jgi:hypothetical protein